jgi:uncharacterized membrane protein
LFKRDLKSDGFPDVIMDRNTTVSTLYTSIWPSRNVTTSTATVYPKSEIVLLTFQIILVCSIFFGNGLVVAAFYRFPKLRLTMTNYFLTSLAAADILYGLSAAFGIAHVHSRVLRKNKYACLVNISIINLCIGVSVFNLFCVASERFVAIAWPLRYPSIVTRNRVISIKAGAIVLSAIFAFLPLAGINRWDGAVKCIPPLVFTKMYSLTGASILSIVLCATLGIYFYIFRVAQSQFERIVLEGGLTNINPGHKPSLKDLKAVKMLLLIVAIFVVCWGTSVCIMAIIISSHGYNAMLEHIGYCLVLLSSALNPLVYACRSQEFRWAFGKLLRCRTNIVNATEDSRQP